MRKTIAHTDVVNNYDTHNTI